MDKNTIHETVIKDVIDLVKGIEDSDAVTMLLGRNNSIKSIASATASLTMVYPVLCSDNVSIDNAMMISKALERKCTTMLNLLLVAHQTTNANNVADYMSEFHSNIRVGDNISVDGMIDVLSGIALDESADITDRQIEKIMSDDIKHNGTVLPDDFNDVSLNEYSILKEHSGYKASLNKKVIKEAQTGEQIALATAIAKNEYRIKNNLKDNDVKKSNELIPTTLQVNFTQMPKEGSDVPPIHHSALIGVKAKLYPVGSEDVISRLVSKTVDQNAFNKFIRATTKEISFFRDFLFAIDQAKLDALSVSNRGSSAKEWKILERRATKSKLRRRLGMKNDATAISFLVVSQEEIELINKEFRVNLENEAIIRPLLEEYNLMGFVIVDSTNEVAKFIFDTGDDLYEHIPFRALERESADNSFKRMVNLISKTV